MIYYTDITFKYSYTSGRSDITIRVSENFNNLKGIVPARSVSHVNTVYLPLLVVIGT